jgi:hypothetical protein
MIGIAFSLVILAIILFFVPSAVFGLNYHPMNLSKTFDGTLENLYGNLNTTELDYQNSKIVLTQSIPKTIYKMGEPIIVNSSLFNTGDHNIVIFHWTSGIATELKYNNGTTADVIGGNFILAGPMFEDILKPGIPNPINLVHTTTVSPNTHSSPARFLIDKPGNYTLLSAIWMRFDSNNSSYIGIALWSKPLQITVLPEQYVQNETVSTIPKIPEFPFAVPVLIIGLVSLLVFYRIKFKM